MSAMPSRRVNALVATAAASSTTPVVVEEEDHSEVVAVVALTSATHSSVGIALAVPPVASTMIQQWEATVVPMEPLARTSAMTSRRVAVLAVTRAASTMSHQLETEDETGTAEVVEEVEGETTLGAILTGTERGAEREAHPLPHLAAEAVATPTVRVLHADPPRGEEGETETGTERDPLLLLVAHPAMIVLPLVHALVLERAVEDTNQEGRTDAMHARGESGVN